MGGFWRVFTARECKAMQTDAIWKIAFLVRYRPVGSHNTGPSMPMVLVP